MEQARLRRSLRSVGKLAGLHLLADMIDRQDVSVMSARVGWLVMSCHGIGKRGLARFLREARLGEWTRVRDLSDKRRREVSELIRAFR